MTSIDIDMTGVFPAPRDKLWKLYWMHLWGNALREIHPQILSRKVVREEGDIRYDGLALNALVVDERVVALGKNRTCKMLWKLTFSPPEKWSFEILESDGPFAKGTHYENRFTEVLGGTRIDTKGRVVLEGVRAPRFLQSWFVKRYLNSVDKEDLAYFRRGNL